MLVGSLLQQPCVIDVLCSFKSCVLVRGVLFKQRCVLIFHFVQCTWCTLILVVLFKKICIATKILVIELLQSSLQLMIYKLHKRRNHGWKASLIKFIYIISSVFAFSMLHISQINSTVRSNSYINYSKISNTNSIHTIQKVSKQKVEWWSIDCLSNQ